MSKKHQRLLGVPHGEYYVAAPNPSGADISCVQARHRIAHAVDRSDLPTELEELVAQRLDQLSNGARAKADDVLPIVDDWARRWKLTDWILVYGMIWFGW